MENDNNDNTLIPYVFKKCVDVKQVLPQFAVIFDRGNKY